MRCGIKQEIKHTEIMSFYRNDDTILLAGVFYAGTRLYKSSESRTFS